MQKSAIYHLILHKLAGLLPYSASKRNLIITGAHRTGTTFLGTLLAQSGELSYVYEPLNPDYGTCLRQSVCKYCGLQNKQWYKYLTKENVGPYYKHFKHIVNSRNLRSKRALFKAPFSFMATEWLSEEFNSDVIVMIRNPLAFVSSLKKMEWPFDFNKLYSQKDLLDRYLPKYKEQIAKYANSKPTIIEQGILFWNIIYDKVQELNIQHPDWIYLKLEDLSAQPYHHMENICNQFDIIYSDAIKVKIKELTAHDNPAESDKNIVHSLHRNSKDAMNVWKERLTETEINQILIGTKEVGIKYYPEIYS